MTKDGKTAKMLNGNFLQSRKIHKTVPTFGIMNLRLFRLCGLASLEKTGEPGGI